MTHKFVEYIEQYLSNKIDYAGNKKYRQPIAKQNQSTFIAQKMMDPAFLNRVMRMKGPHTSMGNIKENINYAVEVKNEFVYITIYNSRDFRVGIVSHLEQLFRKIEDVHSGVVVEYIKYDTEFPKDRRNRPYTYGGVKKKTAELKIRISLDVLDNEKPSIPKPETFDVADYVDFDKIANLVKEEKSRLWDVVCQKSAEIDQARRELDIAKQAHDIFRNKFNLM
ncbi:hypothetical protein HPMBJEAJ_00370 [Aeromonas phage avDM6]|nr:hypothetical protein HPMBJEAJ_00370 [Aeromonas phage avDM6]